MIAIIFKLTPKADAAQRYVALAEQFRTELKSIDGFVSVERFESLAPTGPLALAELLDG